jgi:hypothetical protein
MTQGQDSDDYIWTPYARRVNRFRHELPSSRLDD